MAKWTKMFGGRSLSSYDGLCSLHIYQSKVLCDRCWNGLRDKGEISPFDCPTLF